MSSLATGIKECLLVASRLKAYCAQDLQKMTDDKSEIYWCWLYLRDLYNLLLVDYNKSLRRWEQRTDHGIIAIGYDSSNWWHYYKSFFVESIIPGTFQAYMTKLYNEFKTIPVPQSDGKEKHKKIVIEGAGGYGKSTLARMFAYEASSHNFYDLVCWMNAESEEDIKLKFLEIIRKLEFHAKSQKMDIQPHFINERSKMSEILMRTNDLLELKIRQAPLFIFDNAKSYEKISSFIPQVGHTIVTTREDPKEEAISLNLGVFSEQEAVAYIQKRINPEIPYYDDVLIKETFNKKARLLAQKLDNHPLALSVACAYIMDPRSTVRDGKEQGMNIDIFLNRFDELFVTLVNYEEKKGITKSLYITLKMSIDRLSDEERFLFFKLCYMTPNGIDPNFIGRNGRLLDLIIT